MPVGGRNVPFVPRELSSHQVLNIEQGNSRQQEQLNRHVGIDRSLQEKLGLERKERTYFGKGFQRRLGTKKHVRWEWFSVLSTDRCDWLLRKPFIHRNYLALQSSYFLFLFLLNNFISWGRLPIQRLHSISTFLTPEDLTFQIKNLWMMNKCFYILKTFFSSNVWLNVITSKLTLETKNLVHTSVDSRFFNANLPNSKLFSKITKLPMWILPNIKHNKKHFSPKNFEKLHLFNFFQGFRVFKNSKIRIYEKNQIYEKCMHN